MSASLHTPRRIARLLAASPTLLAGASVLLSFSAQAQLPPPPVSPAPVLSLEYDAQGNPTRSMRAGLATSQTYDALNRRVRTTDARGKNTGYGYNGREDLTQVTDPRSLVTQYPRTGLGEATGLLSPDTGSASYTLDAAGKLLTRTDSRGVVTTYAYDAIDRLTNITFSQAGQPPQSFGWTYDQPGPSFGYGVGRLTSAQFPSGSATYSYDELGRLRATHQTVGNGSVTWSHGTSYGYDAAGRVVSVTYPSGRTLLIPHVGGQPTGMSLAPPGAAAIPLLNALQFEPSPGALGPARSWNWQLAGGGSLVHSRVFDSYGRMVRHPLGGAVRDISYDTADRIAAYTHYDAVSGSRVTALDQGFGYDDLDRLTSIGTSVGNWSIAYDDNGNRTLVNIGSGGATVGQAYTIDANSNRLLSISNPSRSFGFDAAGNIVADTAPARQLQVGIDPSGRMATVSQRTSVDGVTSEVSASYVHDGAGLRVLKQVVQGPSCQVNDPGAQPVCDWPRATPNEGTIYLYDPAGRLLGEYRLNDGSVIREYVWLQGMPVAVIDGSAANPIVYYVQTDHLDTPRVMLDRQGRQRWTWVAEPFGNSAPVENPLGIGAVVLNLRMPGQYFDAESGVAYNWHRSFDAGVGRYTQSDPIGLAGGINTYAYVAGNPLSFADPRGLDNPGLGPYGPFPGKMGFRRGVPGDSCTCMFGPDTFYAPPGTNFGDVHSAGQANGWSPNRVNDAVGHWGTFDFQRDVGMNQFTGAYTNAANFAVGAYMHGAGYGRATTLGIARGFAMARSSNAGDQNQAKYQAMGWDAANSGKFNLQYACQCTCP